MHNLVTLRTGTVHATQRKWALHSLCGFDFTMSDFTVPALAGGSVNCENCLRMIAKAHAEALELHNPTTIVKTKLLGTRAVHVPLNGLQEGDGAMASLCKPDKAMLKGTWVAGDTTCGVCVQRITSVHVKALALNEWYDAGVRLASSWTSEEIENAHSTYSDLDLTYERAAEAKWLRTFLTSGRTSWRNRLTSIRHHARQLALVNAEITRREKIVAFAEDLASRPAMASPERTASMPTENNYGEKQGPFVFTDHPHDQIRAERYDDLCTTLLAMVTQAKRPTPSSELLAAAVVGLDHTEAIEEDRARFPYESFTRFEMPVPCGYRHKDGSIERPVFVIGSDVSRRVYKQNVVLIVRSDNSVPQVVGEGDLVN